MAADDEDEDDNRHIPPYEEDEPENGVFRWMSTLVVLLAVAGFFGLAWYAYRNGGDSVDEKQVELVKADVTPVKEAPANPGGMEIPNQDKTVYGLISGKGEKPVVERILPAPEEPVARGDTRTWMSDSMKNKTEGKVEAVKITPVTSQSLPAPQDPSTSQPSTAAEKSASDTPKEQFTPKLHADGTPQTLAPQPVIAADAGNAKATVKPEPDPTTGATPAAKPAATAEKKPSVAEDKEEDADDEEGKTDDKPAPAKASAKPDSAKSDTAKSDIAKADTAKPASTPPAGGVRAQLGAYKSESEANSDWIRISHKFADDIQGKKHYVVRADLGAKGIYYRLQMAPFASPHDAEAFCMNLVSSGQGCMAAKGK